MNYLLSPISRILVSVIFILSGIGKIFAFSQTAGYMEQHGFFAARFFLIGAIIFELFGGLLLLSGFLTRFAAIGLIVFLIPATLIFHVPNISEQAEMIAVLKNLAIIGALLKFYIDGPGELSVDGKASYGIV